MAKAEGVDAISQRHFPGSTGATTGIGWLLCTWGEASADFDVANDGDSCTGGGR